MLNKLNKELNTVQIGNLPCPLMETEKIEETNKALAWGKPRLPLIKVLKVKKF